MGTDIIIFWKEEETINDPFLRILQDPSEILQASPRLKVINDALKNNNLDSSIATLFQTLLEKTYEPLRRILAIAFLKEFVYGMWDLTLQDDYTLPISFIGIIDVCEFDGDVLFEEINNFMNIDNPLIYSLKVYFLRELRHKGLSIDDIKRFCVAHINKFPWLSTFKWNDKELYSIGDKAPLQAFIRQLQNINAFRARVALIGLIIIRLHVVRASRKWEVPENQAADLLKVIDTMNNLSVGYKQTVKRILSNDQSLIRLDNTIDNSNLFLKSVIAHSIVSNIESLSSVVTGSGGPISRQPMETIIYPECENNTIYEVNHLSVTVPIKPKDQPGYIGEHVNNSTNHSVRSMSPFSYRILHLIVHALIGSSAHSPATLTFLCRHNQIANNTEHYCLGHIIDDWIVLRRILNCSDVSLVLLFHSLLTKMTQTPLPVSTLKTSVEREDWETQFTRNYVFPLIESVTETVTSFRTALAAASAGQGNNTNITESEIDQIRMIDEEYRFSKLPRLWRKIDE
ncbi:5506_t:CDS:2, partial [Racocetra persica]